MDHVLISSNSQLAEVCLRARQHPAVALDTEFVRTRTLIPHLGLIQLYDGQQLILIDPLPITDFRPFVELLEDPKVVKVLHSSSEDLEALLSAFDTLPAPLFDTQFAASVLGMGSSLGYAKLMETLCEVTLDKGESRTDWLARPLSENQLHYAANDVLYLLPAYQQLHGKIVAHGKLSWVFEELAVLGERKRTSMPLEYAYLLIKNNWRLDSRGLTVLQHLAAWRLNYAREKDLAVNFVVKEMHLYELAERLPDSKTAMSKIHGILPQTMRLHAQTVLNIIANALAEYEQLDPEERLAPVKRLVDVPAYKRHLAAVKEISTRLAEENHVAIEVMASKKQMNQVLKWWWFDIEETFALGVLPDLLSGWRRELYQAPLIELLGPMPEHKVAATGAGAS